MHRCVDLRQQQDAVSPRNELAATPNLSKHRLVFGSEPGEIGSPPGSAMMDNPVDQRGFESNVPASLFALDPFVPEDFLFLGAECLVKTCLYQAFRPRFKFNECHEEYYRTDTNV